MTRNEAKAMGLKLYSTGSPCSKGHLSERRVDNGGCVICARERASKWQKNFPEKANARTSKWGYANREKTSAKARAWANANAERYKAKIHEWHVANRDRRAAIACRYRAAKLSAAPSWADHEAIGLIYRAAEVARVIWPDVEVDHVIPLQGKKVSGLHVHTNLQLLTAKANQSKSNNVTI